MNGVPASGFYVEKDGKSFLYTGDMTVGSVSCWDGVCPDVLITEVTADDSYTEKFSKGPHLTPKLLKDELLVFKDKFGYLPRVFAVHMTPSLETLIQKELGDLSDELGCVIVPGAEDLEIDI